MATSGAITFISIAGVSSALAQSTETEEPAAPSAFDGDKSGDWLFPADKLIYALPRWVRFGGEYRTPVESADGITYTTKNDRCLLSRFRFNVAI